MGTASPYDRMMQKVIVDDETGCWLFQGARHSGGYGNVRVKVDGRWTCRTAHKVSYEHHHGTVPEGLVVRHKCDVRVCINPGHLTPGTQKENIADIIERDRGANQYGPYVGHVNATDDCPF